MKIAPYNKDELVIIFIRSHSEVSDVPAWKDYRYTRARLDTPEGREELVKKFGEEVWRDMTLLDAAVTDRQASIHGVGVKHEVDPTLTHYVLERIQ